MPAINRFQLAATIEGFSCWWLLAWHSYEIACLNEPSEWKWWSRMLGIRSAHCIALTPGTPTGSSAGKHCALFQGSLYPDWQKWTKKEEKMFDYKEMSCNPTWKKLTCTVQWFPAVRSERWPSFIESFCLVLSAQTWTSWSEKMRNRLLEAEQLPKSDAYKSCQSKAKSQWTFWPQTVPSSANLSRWKDVAWNAEGREREMSATSSWGRVVFCSALSCYMTIWPTNLCRRQNKMPVSIASKSLKANWHWSRGWGLKRCLRNRAATRAGLVPGSSNRKQKR